MLVQGRWGLDYPGQRRQAAPQHLRTEAALPKRERAPRTKRRINVGAEARASVKRRRETFLSVHLFPTASGEAEGSPETDASR